MIAAAHLDYETRSELDLTKVGAFRYGVHPSTHIMMCAVSASDSDQVFLWIHPDYQTADEPGENEQAEAVLRAAIRYYAFNMPFEFAITWGALDQGKPCPFAEMPRIDQLRCVQAMARKAGLPDSLEKMGEALSLTHLKDRRGKALITFFCEPRKDGLFNQPRDFPEKWQQFCDYCRQDTRTEKAGHVKLSPFELSGSSLATFLFTLRMNLRGIPVNVPALRHAQGIVDKIQNSLTEQFRQLTELNPTQNKAFKAWFNEKFSANLDNLQGETIDAIVEKPPLGMPCAAVQMLEMYQKVSYAAVKKVRTMLDSACPDGRVRGTFEYYGAGTGRWSARGMQPHNFKKTPKWMREMMDEVFARICAGASADRLDLVYGDPLELIAGVIRNFIIAGFDGDYSAIEARIVVWLAGQEDVLQQWRDYDAGKGPDQYRLMAGDIYEMPEPRVDSDQREVGKRTVLGCGYNMGPDKFQSSCLELYQLDLPIELCVKAVKAYRKKHDKVVRYWYFLDDAAREAIRVPGTRSGPFICRTIAGIPYLLFYLRSGRALAYAHPKLERRSPTAADLVKMKNWTPERREKYLTEITYWGNIKGALWGRVKLYGGKFTENECQGTAADLMAFGSMEAERQGFPLSMLVHDQGLADDTPGKTPEQFAAALATLPAWAKGLPLKVEAKRCKYYRK